MPLVKTPESLQHGFTLLELLVAITVLAMVSLIAWRGLDSLVHTRERLGPQAEQVRALLVAFGQIEQDLAHVVNTDFVRLPSAAVNTRDNGIDLVRFAAVAPGAVTAVQTVAYEVRDGRLLREATPPADAVGAGAGQRLPAVVLLTDVRTLQVRVWQAGRGWVPPSAGAAPAARGAAGIEIVVELADGLQFRRVMLVG